MKRFLTVLLTICLLLTVVGPLSVPVSAEEAYWYDDATISEQMGTITRKNGVAQFSCKVPYEDGGNLALKLPFSAPNKAIDVSFKMRIEGSWTTREMVNIQSGGHRAYFGFRSNGIYLQTKNGGQMIYCNVANAWNTYRIRFESDGLFDFYFNGRPVAKDVPLPTNSSSPDFSFTTYGGNGGSLSQFSVQDVKVYEVKVDAAAAAGGDPPSWTTPPAPWEYDFTPDEDLSEWRMGNNDTMWIDTEQGFIAADHLVGYTSNAAFHRLTFADEFILEHRVRFEKFGDQLYYKDHYPGDVFHLSMSEVRFHTDYFTGDSIPPGHLVDGEWHDMKFESHQGKKYVKVYIDGQLVADLPTEESTRPYYHVQIGVQSSAEAGCVAQLDWIKYTPVWNGNATMAMPIFGDEYLEGEPINLAVYVKEGVDAEKVEYKLNGVVVATGTKENDYQAQLTGIPAGHYSMTVACEGTESTPTEFDVAPARKNAIQTAWAGDGKVNASLYHYDELSNVASVEYLVNGISAGSSDGAPFQVTLPVSSTEASSVVALCKDANGVILEKLAGTIAPDLSNGTTHYSNEISYETEGSGSAAVEVSTGLHQLKLSHTASAMTYLTDGGEKSIPSGNGKYTILTDGPFADVYYQGKLAASFRMPMTSQVTKSVTENGMSVKDFSVTIPENRQNYVVAKNLTGKNVYQVPGLNDNYYYNVDFLASPEDGAKITVNDTIFRTEMELKNGKIYATSGHALDSEPLEMELCDMVEGEAHYRVAAALGMVSVFANGKFITSFRGTRAVGEATMGVEVTAGDGLSHLNLNDYTDIYLYQDDFNNVGLSATKDYWYAENGMTNYFDADAQSMVMIADGKTNAISEIDAYVRESVTAADVKVKSIGDDAGFWMLASRSGHTQTWTKAGYNFKTKSWEIEDRYETESTITNVSVPGELKVGETIHMELKIVNNMNNDRHSGRTATLYVNGVPVVSRDIFGAGGKVGFMANDCTAAVENYSFRGDAKPLLDVRDVEMAGGDGEQGFGATTSGFIAGDRITVAQQGIVGHTDDYGKTWIRQERVATDRHNVHMLRLNSGEIISLYMNEGVTAWGTAHYNAGGSYLYQLQFYMSEDDGLTWTPKGYLRGPEPEYGRALTGNTVGALSQAPDGPNGEPGRIFMVGDYSEETSENTGDTWIFYSDDKGETWNLSTVITYEDNNFGCMQEQQMVATKEWVRCYYRNDRGMIRYFQSNDNGITWDLNSKPTPFFAALNCNGFEVVRTYDENGEMKEDLYAFWSGDSQNLGERFQFPRTNYRLAKSSDYGETWEFVGMIHENSFRKYHQVNMSLVAFDGWAFYNSQSDKNVDGSGGNLSRGGLIPITKQVATMRDQRLRPQWMGKVSEVAALRANQVDRLLLLDAESGAGLLNGMRMEGIAIENGIGVDYAAAFVGAKAEITGNQVTLKAGEAAETFDVVEKDGKKYIPADEFAKRYGFYLNNYDGVISISPYDGFTWRGAESVTNALRLF